MILSLPYCRQAIGSDRAAEKHVETYFALLRKGQICAMLHYILQFRHLANVLTQLDL